MHEGDDRERMKMEKKPRTGKDEGTVSVQCTVQRPTECSQTRGRQSSEVDVVLLGKSRTSFCCT